MPQILEHLGAIQYSAPLRTALLTCWPLPSSTARDCAAGEVWQPRDRREVEIRGCSIHAVEARVLQHRLCVTSLQLITQAARTLAGARAAALHLNAVLVDFFLWDYATTHRAQLQASPIHRIRSIFY